MTDRSSEYIDKAKAPLLKAVDFEKKGKINDALPYYIEGIALLGKALSYMPKTGERSGKILQTQKVYIERAELLKGKCKFQVDFLEQRRIEADSTGHGYDKVFSKCCDERLTWVDVQDAYIVKHHQLLNFLRFCELVTKLSPNLKTISLKTSKDAESNRDCFAEMAESLEKRRVTLHVEYRTTIHDREIAFDNGWCVKIGRGLDYFKPCGKYTLGACDQNLRPCHETIIDIFKRKVV